MSKTTLITGGVRSGKSDFAQELAAKSSGPVLFVATAEAGDEEMRRRIEKHKQARPAVWSTVEATTHIGSHVLQKIGTTKTVIVDCITLLINNILLQHIDHNDELIDDILAEQEVLAEISELVDCIKRVNASFIIVTNEVGLGIVPANKMVRVYRDLLGKANQTLAQHADEVYLMVAGIPLLIKPASSL